MYFRLSKGLTVPSGSSSRPSFPGAVYTKFLVPSSASKRKCPTEDRLQSSIEETKEEKDVAEAGRGCNQHGRRDPAGNKMSSRGQRSESQAGPVAGPTDERGGDCLDRVAEGIFT